MHFVVSLTSLPPQVLEVQTCMSRWGFKKYFGPIYFLSCSELFRNCYLFFLSCFVATAVRENFDI